MNYVVDAAVALKWFVAEPMRPAALRLLDPNLALHAPDLILVEMAELARLKLRRGEMAAEQAQEALRQAPAYFDTLHPAREHHERALQLSLQLGRPVEECCYLACAELLEASLITADRDLAALRSDLLAAPILHLAALSALTA